MDATAAQATQTRRGPSETRAELLDQIVAQVDHVPRGVSREELTDFVGAYFARNETTDLLGSDPAALAAVVRAHLLVGERREPASDTVVVVTQASPQAWDTGGSTYVLIVTDDRPFLVDTVSLVLAGRDWSVRNLYHPQLIVTRHADGVLDDVWKKGHASTGTAESWIAVEAYAPLGTAAEDLSDDLAEALRAGLRDVRDAVDDWDAMRARLEASVQWLDRTAQPVSAHEVGQATSLLRWLAADHFAFLGYHEYRVEGDEFTAVPGTGLGILRGEPDAEGTFHAVADAGDPAVLVMTKDSRRSPVHRPAYLDYVGVRVHEGGRLVGEHRFLGLLTANAYAESVGSIPVLADKVARIAELSGYDADSHAGHAIAQAIASYPRDELFEASAEELFEIIDKIAGLQGRRQVRLFVRPGRYGRNLACTVFLPRDQYTTAVRLRVQEVLLRALGGESLEYQASVTESLLARLFVVVRLPQGASVPDYDVTAIEAELAEAVRTWDDGFHQAASVLLPQERGVEFGTPYKAAFTPAQAVADLRLANELTDDADLRYAVYRPDEADDPADLRFKVVGARQVSLTRVMPHLDALGVDVVDERPFEWTLRGRSIFLYDFGFKLPAGQTHDDWDADDRRRFADAFDASWRGVARAGVLNRLVMRAGLTWQQVVRLRGLSRYLQQAGIPFSQAYVAAALNANPGIAASLVDAFEAKFDPAREGDLAARTEAVATLVAGIERDLEEVASLDHDRIVRMFLAVLGAVRRTNAFAEDQPALAFKIAAKELALLPQPRPDHEIFVMSPRVQGVHMRFGAVARGGLRWSDRAEDFRTEVLGLAKAQMVKNTVIVPVGAKGGFVPQHLPDPAVDRQAWLDEGVACYQLFIGSLLSVTDNLVGGEVVPPIDVVRWDGDDPYLVVAADKGTASFSDHANAISTARGFWLGDAFASGGSAGYDHKGMGITARGAWESVKRHFFEVGIDCQNEDFTCVGIGDMAGDVFGNGMLRSRHTKLVAAFNHAHVFLDPDPDAEASFAERERLFALPRSSWADYDPALISAGGGVYPRSAKAVPITPEVRGALGLADDVTRLTPTELITAILQAPVDLLYNGGIGTYVKASTESHTQAGDKANDAVRVNGSQVRARCVGEGGNLGWTQAGRIEYAAAGGRINTDFIDNSAGVDTSDHEVNIKILLAGVVEAGELTTEQRNELLASMTDEVAHLVLAHNIDQNRALADALARSADVAGTHEDWMRSLEASGHLDRALEDLPSRAQMAERIEAGVGLHRPELGSLLAWTKIRLAELALESDLPDDPYLADRLVTYFPKPLAEPYADEMAEHPLRREIVATVTVNRFVNSMGITAFHRLSTETGADVGRIVRAQLAARTIFSIARTELAVARADGIDADADVAVRAELQHLTERATRWLLHNRRHGLDIRAEAERFTEGVGAAQTALPSLLTTRQREVFESAVAALVEGGLDEGLAERTAACAAAHHALPVVAIATETGADVLAVAGVHFEVAQVLGIDAVAARIDALPRTSRWDTMARAALRDELEALHEQLTRAVLSRSEDGTPSVSTWLEGLPHAEAERATLTELLDAPADLARLSVALRTIRTLLA